MLRDKHTVLVVDDDEEIVQLFERWLEDEYEVKTATDGVSALEELDDVDVALLDRKLPMLSGDAVAAEIEHRGADCMTAIISGVEPDTDIVHISCGEYLVKPVERKELLETVERLRRWARYDDQLAECAELAAKRGALESSHSREELERDSEYLALCHRITMLLEELDDMVEAFDAEDFEAAFETPDFAGRARIRRAGWISSDP